MDGLGGLGCLKSSLTKKWAGNFTFQIETATYTTKKQRIPLHQVVPATKVERVGR